MAPAGVDWVTALVLLLVSFAPPLLYLAWVRSFDRRDPEPWGRLLLVFAWGAIGAVIVAIVLQVLLAGTFVYSPVGALAILEPAFFSTVVVAPFVEEFAKGLGLTRAHDAHPEPEDGFVYGAGVGLGFAATENLLYIGDALVFQGVAIAAWTAVLRIFASALLHAGVSAILGYGIWRARFAPGGWGILLGTYLAAVAIHSLFNVLATFAFVVTLAVAIAVAMGFFAYVRHRIRQLDRQDHVLGHRRVGDAG